MTETSPMPERPGAATAVGRGMLMRCPRCGKGKLFSSYLKQVDRCAHCAEDLSDIRPDDAAPWLTILTVGILLGPIIGLVETHVAWPVGVSMAVWIVAALALMLVILPRAKGVLINLIWMTRRSTHED